MAKKEDALQRVADGHALTMRGQRMLPPSLAIVRHAQQRIGGPSSGMQRPAMQSIAVHSRA